MTESQKELVEKMRFLGYGYRSIANRLGLKRDTVDFERLLAVLKKLRKDNFSIIFLDQNNASAPSEKLNNNIYIIHEYEKLTTPDWVGELFAGKYPAAESNVQKLRAIIK